MSKMREEFEEFARGNLMSVATSDGRLYKNRETHEAWVVWQASRDAKAIELPPEPDGAAVDEFSNGERQMLARVKNYILEAGFRVNGVSDE